MKVYTLLIASAACLQVAGARPLDETFLSSLRAEAARSHPAATAANLRAEAAATDIRSVRLWDDPTAGLSFMGARREMRREDGDIMVGIEQPLPKPGLNAAELGRADALRRAAREKARASALEVSAMAAKLAIELALADDAIGIQTGELAWLRTMTDNARQQAINPNATSVDALRLESELARETQNIEAAERTRESLAGQLNLLLGRALESPWPVLALPPAPPAVPIASGEIARIPHANPTVRSMLEMAGAAAAETTIADRKRQPAFSVGLESALYSGGDHRSTTLGVKVSLPWFNDPAYRADVSAAKSREHAAAKDVETVRLDIAGKVLAAATEASNAAAQARAYGGEIYDKTLAASQSLEGSWISSTAPLTDLLDSRRLLFSVRLEARRYIAMQQAALEDLEALLPSRYSAAP